MTIVGAMKDAGSVGPTPTVDDTPQSEVGVIGLGAIGQGVCNSLVRSGRRVVVFDVRSEAVQGLTCPARRAESAAALADTCQVVLLAVLDEEHVRQALVGAKGLLSGARAGLIVVLLSTVSVKAVHEFAQLCAAQQVHLVDCGVTPGDQAPLNGLVGFVGGPTAVVARAMPVLTDFARSVLHCGPIGAGMTVKIARNVISYCSWAVVDEAVNLAVAAGVSASTVHDALKEADAKHPQYLKMLDVRASGMYIPPERIETAHTTATKDLEAAAELAAAFDVEMPLAQMTGPLIHDVFEKNRAGPDT